MANHATSERLALLDALDELKRAGLIDYRIGAERTDGTGPQLDVWTTADTLRHLPALDGLSARAKAAWGTLTILRLAGSRAI